MRSMPAQQNILAGNDSGLTRMPTPPIVYPPKLAKAILAVTREINPVKKEGWNDFHKYAYRKFEDVFEELVPLINHHGLLIMQDETSHGGFAGDLIEISYEFTILDAETGEVWPKVPKITAICKVRDGKGVLDDKAASKCCTQAQKYFYTSFFKIRSVDTSEADADSGSKRPARAVVPSPDGIVKPHMIEIINGEDPSEWAKRFGAKMTKSSKTPEDVDAWFAANAAAFKKLESKEEFKPVYDWLITAMDTHVLALTGAKPAEKPAEPESDFPGDKKPVQARETVRQQPTADIPIHLDRQLTAAEQDWLVSLGEAYDGCTTAEELASEQDSLMMPSQDNVSQHAWTRAMGLTKQHLDRVNNG